MVKRKELEQYTVQMIAEAFSTSILILIGEAAIANYKFTQKPSHSTLPIAIAFGVGVYAAMMISGPMTGAHLNPALSISLMTIRKLKSIQCIFYVIGQISGAFFGAGLVYLVYWNEFNQYDGGRRQMSGPNGTADIFFTMPDKGIPQWNTFLDQVLSTAFLMIFVMSVTYDFNQMISEKEKPFAFALVIIAITSAFSINAGAAINPARDLGPRIFAGFVYGWKDVFEKDNYFFWIPILGPILGAIIGVWIYQAFLWIVKEYGHFPDIQHDNQEKKGDQKSKKMKDDNESLELKKKLTDTDGDNPMI